MLLAWLLVLLGLMSLWVQLATHEQAGLSFVPRLERPPRFLELERRRPTNLGCRECLRGRLVVRRASPTIGMKLRFAQGALLRWWRGSVGAQILSDVDDTIKCSGGPRGGGIDEKEIYPGAVQFMLEIARGRAAGTFTKDRPPPNVRLLSARPEKLGFLRMKPTSKVAREFQRVAKANELPSWGIDFQGSKYGRIRDVFPALLGDFRPFGRTKLRNWEEVLGNDVGQQKAVFLGDNGQGDVQAARDMAMFGPPFVAAFIHQVAERKAVDHPRIRYFHGYLEASKIALQIRLISPSGHCRVGRDVNASNLARLCRLHAADPQTYSHYPCISETGDLLWPDGSPVPEALGLRADDQTTRLRKCGSSKAMMLINQGNRCAKLLAELEEFRRWEQGFDKGSLQLLQPLYRMLVRTQIAAMVAALKEEQAAEVKKKDYCIENLQKNRLASDDKKREGDEFSAAAEDLKQKVKALEMQTADVQAQVGELKKQQKLAAQNREKENAEFQKVVEQQRQTQVLLKNALSVLAAFYNKKDEGSFLQKANPKEPETFGGYKKNSANNGVMMMLQQLMADAKEMEAESTAAEREAQKDYEDFGKETIAALATKDKELQDQAEQKAKLSERMVQARQSKEGAEAEVQNLAGLKEDLHETCDFLVANFDARQKARADEVEALLEAKSNLSGAK
ncbi:hypothetical protein AK812_SmicGene31400 [Symbiodinium microadriaticum]|uniref:Phosphatidate phosphatase APP1 catalytic domain-containing protein n=1 Tax=Symbiodinium microadriaticum TaxID=2951 RepID=A0A1Q9CWS6_SYMMI|nr:hypothetical protein AK812_SmicGene31400 [Symbiodinium microadriaticum]